VADVGADSKTNEEVTGGQLGFADFVPKGSVGRDVTGEGVAAALEFDPRLAVRTVLSARAGLDFAPVEIVVVGALRNDGHGRTFVERDAGHEADFNGDAGLDRGVADGEACRRVRRLGRRRRFGAKAALPAARSSW